MVHSAGIQDRIGAKQVLTKLVSVSVSRAEVQIWADGGYAGKLVEWVAAILQLRSKSKRLNDARHEVL